MAKDKSKEKVRASVSVRAKKKKQEDFLAPTLALTLYFCHVVTHMR